MKLKSRDDRPSWYAWDSLLAVHRKPTRVEWLLAGETFVVPDGWRVKAESRHGRWLRVELELAIEEQEETAWPRMANRRR